MDELAPADIDEQSEDEEVMSPQELIERAINERESWLKIFRNPDHYFSRYMDGINPDFRARKIDLFEEEKVAFDALDPASATLEDFHRVASDFTARGKALDAEYIDESEG